MNHFRESRIQIQFLPLFQTNFRVLNFSTCHILLASLCETCCPISPFRSELVWKLKFEFLPLFPTDFLNFDEWSCKTSEHVDEQV